MRRIVAAGLTLAVALPTLAWALGADHSAHPVSSDQWPAGLAAIVNAENRVHGYFVNWSDVFFFRGDTAALNDFLARCAQLPGAKLSLVVHAGRLAVRSPWDEQPRDVAADWQLSATSVVVDRSNAFTLRVDAWLGTSIDLDALRVPAGVAVSSGGEIDAFVRRHAPTTAPAPVR